MPSDLSENEYLVLKAISEGLSDPGSVAHEQQMKIETARAAADLLAEQGLIQVHKSVDETFSLTDEGAAYAREGLPERRLLLSLGGGMPMSEMKDPALKIGLGWLRKKGWATIEGGLIKPLKDADKGEDELILEALRDGVSSNPKWDEKALAALKSRGLVTSSKSKEWRYIITESGRLAITKLEPKRSGTKKEVLDMPALTAEMIKSGEW